MKKCIAMFLVLAALLPALNLGAWATEADTSATQPVTEPTTEVTEPTEQTTDPTEQTTDPTEETTEPTQPTISGPLTPQMPLWQQETPEDGVLLSVEEQVAWEAEQSFLASQKTANRESFHGYCGLMVSHQMFNLRINKYFYSNDGNKLFDYYAKRKKTTGGYSITPYYSEQYELQDALNAVSSYGLRDVRNILVGFQWTDTEAGQKYGHAVFINGIIQGKVYFVESFDCFIGGKTVPEGNLITCSIETFANYFSRWTVFDGLVHFGAGTYEEVCPRKETAVYLRARFDAVLRTAPCVIGTWDCKEVQPVSAGQRLFATALYQGDRGLYYRVTTQNGDAFISAAAVSLEVPDPEDISLSQSQISRQLKAGRSMVLVGTVDSQLGSLTAVDIAIYNELGNRVARSRVVTKGEPVLLENMNHALQTQKLTPGQYILEIYAEADYPVADNGAAVIFYQKRLLVYQKLQVVGVKQGSKLNYTPQMPELYHPDGWDRKDGKWYYYENGKAKIGWLNYMGLRYYFGTDGAAVTGWQTIGNDLRYFDPDGHLVKNTEMTYGKTIYQLDKNGVAWFKAEVKKKKK